MLTRSKIAVALAIAALSITSPAFALSTQRGNVQPPAASQMTRHSFNNPALTGGGSSGYNWDVRHDA